MTDTPESARGLVKPLEWGRDAHFLDEFATSSAPTPFGRYFAYEKGYWGPGTIIASGYSVEKEAQAAAQADYERRILSALNPDALAEIETLRADNARVRNAMESLLEAYSYVVTFHLSEEADKDPEVVKARAELARTRSDTMTLSELDDASARGWSDRKGG